MFAIVQISEKHGSLTQVNISTKLGEYIGSSCQQRSLSRSGHGGFDRVFFMLAHLVQLAHLVCSVCTLFADAYRWPMAAGTNHSLGQGPETFP